MSHMLARFAGPAALCAALLFASAAPAAVTAPTSSKAPHGKAAKERAHGKQCAPKHMRGGARSPDFAKCVVALSRLASGRSSSPKNACRQLSHKRSKGRKTSPFERCVKAGTKLVKAQEGADRSEPDAPDEPSEDVLPGDNADLPDADIPDPSDSDAPPPTGSDDPVDLALFGSVPLDVP